MKKIALACVHLIDLNIACTRVRDVPACLAPLVALEELDVSSLPVAAADLAEMAGDCFCFLVRLSVVGRTVTASHDAALLIDSIPSMRLLRVHQSCSDIDALQADHPGVIVERLPTQEYSCAQQYPRANTTVPWASWMSWYRRTLRHS